MIFPADSTRVPLDGCIVLDKALSCFEQVLHRLALHSYNVIVLTMNIDGTEPEISYFLLIPFHFISLSKSGAYFTHNATQKQKVRPGLGSVMLVATNLAFSW